MARQLAVTQITEQDSEEEQKYNGVEQWRRDDTMIVDKPGVGMVCKSLAGGDTIIVDTPKRKRGEPDEPSEASKRRKQ